MGNNLYYKKYIEKLINSNPTTINITRIEKIPDSYGGYTEKTIEITETVTFYQKKSNRQMVSDSGTTIGYISSTVDKILAKGNADILEGDIFVVDNKEYRALFVKPYFDICKQAEVEVIRDGIQDN